ncbi:MAG: hypothetical protein F6K48_09450 [Okeania sp. SIO3H1]|uniref:hypothetical protein n=1 Tax=Okeania sp. SIO1I7 TaxID=2607772 RepID=UPI0013CD7370|nr:hypothetical protein [Okeania sp. SIO1I7]NEN89115.1 hypothetical protein [Okeania sp. SIO3H1]NET25292.1 hypothetical protein [Okeania sp. SIO1I7]
MTKIFLETFLLNKSRKLYERLDIIIIYAEVRRKKEEGRSKKEEVRRKNSLMDN